MQWAHLLVVFVIVLSAPAWCEDLNGLLAGNVRDSEGAAIRDAHVSIYWNHARAGDFSTPEVFEFAVKTDAKGEYSMELIPGFYDVCVHAMAFSPTCQTVAITTGQTAKYEPRLNANALIVREIGEELIPNPVPTIHSTLPNSVVPRKSDKDK
ncbi:MAG TPA: carboxypeptidase-like regulatory domain-containing protein [Terriglobales bacterium]|nr:carboxypeptidase-like regulatory domain-containing protein [Terriglobales bacterium]